jgi:hypothetical protein
LQDLGFVIHARAALPVESEEAQDSGSDNRKSDHYIGGCTIVFEPAQSSPHCALLFRHTTTRSCPVGFQGLVMKIGKMIGVSIGLLIGFVIGFILASYWHDPGVRPALPATSKTAG